MNADALPPSFPSAPTPPEPPRLRCGDPRVQRVIALFETLSPADVAGLGGVYAPDARFRDPFNDVRGLDAVQRVFRHMFEALEAPRFELREALVEDERAFLTWDFLFRLRRSAAEHRIHGGTLLRFDARGRVREHLDYWDAAELYEKIPGLGAPMRWLRRRAAG